MSLSSLLSLIPLPIASLLAVPMLSSWSTSLNLIFISLAWTTLAATYSPLQLELFGPLALRTALYIIPSLIFLIFDIGVPSLAVEFKAQGKWGIATNQRGGRAKLRRVVLWSVANVVLCVIMQAMLEFLVTDVLRLKSLLMIKGSRWGLNHLPSPWAMVKHAIVGVLSRNVSLLHVRGIGLSMLTCAGAPVLHPYTPSALAEWGCAGGLACQLAPQHPDSLLFRCQL